MPHNCMTRWCDTPHDDEGQIYKAQCPVCFQLATAWDITACHLIEAHKWDSERARLFLRDHIEEDAFNEEA